MSKLFWSIGHLPICLPRGYVTKYDKYVFQSVVLSMLCLMKISQLRTSLDITQIFRLLSFGFSIKSTKQIVRLKHERRRSFLMTNVSYFSSTLRNSKCSLDLKDRVCRLPESEDFFCIRRRRVSFSLSFSFVRSYSAVFFKSVSLFVD